MLQGTDRIPGYRGSLRGGTSTDGTHRAPPWQHCAPTKQRPFPSPAVVLPARLNRYYGRLRRPPGQPSTSRFPPVIGHRAPVTTPQVTGPGRASPVPAATLDTFRAPYAGESLTAALPGSSPLPWPSPRFREARHSLLPPEGETSNDAAGFASCYGPHRRSPFTGLLTLGSGPARFQTRPPACYRASWQLPGPDSHRQATTSLRTKRSTMALRHGVTSSSAGRTNSQG